MYRLNPTEFITYKDKLYKVYRKIPVGTIKENHIHDVREAWHCDLVLKTKNQEREIHIFLIEVVEAEVIEETDLTTPPTIGTTPTPSNQV